MSGVAGTPSFFVNGQRQAGAYDLTTLGRAVRTARAQAAIGPRWDEDPLGGGGGGGGGADVVDVVDGVEVVDRPLPEEESPPTSE